MNRHFAFAAAAVATLGLSTVVHADDDTLVRTEPARFESALPVHWGAPTVVGGMYESEDGPDESPAEDFDTALADLLSDEVRAAGGDLFASQEGGMRVEGAEALALVRQRVPEIVRFVHGRGTFRIAVVQIASAADGASAAAVRAALDAKRGRVLWASRFVAERGEPVVRDEIEETTFIAGIDGEVASYASIGDPVISVLRTGLRVGLWQRPIDAERTRAVVSFHLSKVADMERIEVSSGALDIPRVPFVSVSAPLLLRTGQPQTIVVDHPWESGFVALVVEALDLPAAPDLPFRLVDTAALLGVDTGLEAAPMGNGEYTMGWEATEWEPDAPFGRAVGLVDALDAADVGVLALTATIVAVPEGVDVPEVTAGRALHRRVWSSAALPDLPGYDALGGTADREASLPLLAGTIAVRDVRVPVLVGGTTFVVQGTWTRVPMDIDVEIADGAALALPATSAFIDGDRLIARQRPSGAVSVDWISVRALERTSRPLAVRVDLDGKRSENKDDVLVSIRHRRAAGSQIATGPGELEFRHLPSGVEIGLWDVE